MSKRWTESEKEFVRQTVHDLTDAQIANQLGRTEGSVSAFRYRNGINKKGYDRWTSAEDQVIREHWPESPKEKIKELLPNRTIEAIQTRSNFLGVSRSDKFQEDSRYKPKRLVKQTDRGSVTIRSQSDSGIDYVWLNTPKGSIPYHKVRWEEEVGPIPEGYCLVCKTEDRTNTDPDNWKLVSLKDHLARFSDVERATEALRNYVANNGFPAKKLTDGYVAGVLAQGDEELKEIILNERPDLIKTARANYKLKRQINNYDGSEEKTASTEN